MASRDCRKDEEDAQLENRDLEGSTIMDNIGMNVLAKARSLYAVALTYDKGNDDQLARSYYTQAF